MPDVSDMELLRDYDRQGSEAAFAELVRRHINLVYSVAFRHVGIAAQAEEITQAVFVILARKAASLRPDTILEGWLHETTRLTALSFLRGERRRQFREQEAYMQSNLQESTEAPAWNQLAPLLDEAMSRLGKKDRDAVMLRFFKDKNVCEVASALRVSEAAAQRRVLRAVEKLRRFFTKRGVVLPAAVLTAAVSANSVQAAPVALAKTVTAVAITKGSIATASTLSLVKGTIKVMTYAKLKLAIGVTAVILLAGGAATVALSDGDVKTSSPANGRPNSTAVLAGQTNGPMVAIDSQFVVVPDDSIGKLGLTWQPAESGGTMSVLDKSQSSAAMQSLQQTAGVEFLRGNGGGMTSGKTVKNGGRVTTSGKIVKVSVTKPVDGAGTNANIAIVLYVTPFCSSDSSSFELNLTNELQEVQTTISTASVTLESGQTIVMRQTVVASQSPDKKITTSSSLLVFVTPSHFKAGTQFHRLN
jgi:RNA polymerase sigma factor (sigma-70 family)